MNKLSAAVAGFAALAALSGFHTGNGDLFILAAASALCAVTTRRAATISSFMKIFVGIFSAETIVFGLVRLLQAEGLWPAALTDYAPADIMALTVAIFSILVYLVSNIGVVREMNRIADLFFDSHDRGEGRVWPFPAFGARESAIAVAMIVVLVLINQVQVGISVRLSIFNRDWFNAIQEKNATEFWHQLLYIFTPWAFGYVALAVIEFVLQSMLVIRWRRWLTEHYVERWLGGHTHYGMALAGGDADNPDQRIAEDVNRFISGGEDGYGVYSYTILLISTVSSLVSFSVMLWELSGNYPLPGTNIYIPGFLFWVVLLYAALGTLITHLIGRSLTALYFDRQRREADFRFSLARLREYSEQIALLSGEKAERLSLFQRFSGNRVQLSGHRPHAQAVDDVHGHLWPALADHPLCHHRALLFRGTHPARRDDADGELLRAGGERAHLLHQLLHLAGAVQIGARPSELLRRRHRRSAGAGRAHARRVARRGRRTRAAESHAGFARWPRHCARRSAGAVAASVGAADGAVGFGKIAAVSRHRRRVAACRRRDRAAQRRARHAGAAAALYSDGRAGGCDCLSGRARQLCARRH